MATQEKAYAEVGMGELLKLETAVLRTLCLTVNTAGSELKYKILDLLSGSDFYFPVNAAIFACQVIATSDPTLAGKLLDYKEQLARGVAEKSQKAKREFEA